MIIGVQCFYTSAQEIDSSYLLYPNIYKEMQFSRGWNEPEITLTLEKYSRSNINSDQDFADRLSQYYPYKRNVAILLFSYNNNVLERTLFEPGKVKEKVRFNLSKDSLNKLSENLNYALDLYKLTANRSPVLRGIRHPNSSMKYDLNSIIKQLTSILIPADFSPNYKHLIIIPCLNIGSIPFHLLKPYHNDSCLIDKCSFTIAPTLLDFIFLNEKLKANPYKYNDFEFFDSTRFSFEHPLFICNPDYPKDTDYFFPDLPGAEREIKNALTHAYNGFTLLKGEKVIKDSVMKYLNGCDLAYFATHGITDFKNPMTNSFLVLSGNDPFLTSKEIQDLRLRDDFNAPKLVILSACQTGLGKTMDAGVAGSIARSFILSGSNFIIESLWNVDDNATSYLMSRFIYYITERETEYFPSGALRLAILDTKRTFPNPLYWASFSAFGMNL